ncbi:MAG: ABC transporter ATP-binding protein [Acidimicrobiales bacterium]
MSKPATGSGAGWRLLSQSMKQQRRGLILGMLIGLAWAAGRVAIPLLVQLGIDRGISEPAADSNDVGWFDASWGDLGWEDTAWRWSLAILAAGVLSGAMLGLRRYMAFHNARLIESRLRDRVFAHVQRLHFAFHDANATGDLMSRANTDLQQFQNFITMVPMLTGAIVTVVAVTTIMVIIQPLLALLALIGLPSIYFLGRAFSTRLFPAVADVQRQSAALASVVEEAVVGIRVVKGFGAEDLQAEKLSAAADDVYEPSMRGLMTRSRYMPAMEIVPNLGLIVVLAYGGNLVLAGDMTIGSLVSFNIYVILLIQPLRTLGMSVTTGQRSAAAGVRISELLATAPAIVAPDKPAALPAAGARGRIEFNDVWFGYMSDPAAVTMGAGPATNGSNTNGSDTNGSNINGSNTNGTATNGYAVNETASNGSGDHQAVLRGFSLVVEAGETVALVGPTGSGKTTVANLLPRFYDVDDGSITLDGVDIRDLDPQELRRAVGLVFEDTFLFSETIAANIAFADPSADVADVRRAAQAAGADFIDELPEGYSTEVGERGYSLSGGQRQRLAIARAVLAEPRVLILDDATSAVDPTKEHEIADALGDVLNRRTTIVIAHRAATVALADRVVLLDQGRVVDEGTHGELLASSERYRQVLASTLETAAPTEVDN